MNVPFKTVALIGKYNSPEIAKPLLMLGDYILRRGVKYSSTS